MSGIAIYGLFYLCCVAGIFAPWIGITAYFGFTFLNPEWNWRWVIPRGSGFQYYLFVSTLVGCTLQMFQGSRLVSWPYLGIFGLMVYLGLSYISAAFSIDPGLTDFYMSQVWKIVLSVIIAIRLLDTPKKLLAFMWVILLAQGYNSYQINRSYYDVGYCIYVYKTDWSWIGSNQVANRTLCVSAIGAALTIFSDALWKRAVAGFLTLLMLHEIMILQSRGVMIGAVAMCCVYYLFLPKTSFNNSIVAIGVIGIFMLAGQSVVEEFLSSFGDSDDGLDVSAASRFDLWKAGYRIMMDHPLLGVGPYAGSRLVPLFLGDPTLTNKGLHNLWFEIACGSGIAAAISYFTFFLSAMVASVAVVRDRVFRSQSEERASAMACISGLSGFLVANMFSSGGLIEGSYVLAVLGSAGFLIHRSLRNEFLCENLVDPDQENELDLEDLSDQFGANTVDLNSANATA
jgi:putative inorganic carbon (HCO3(-)) transporter